MKLFGIDVGHGNSLKDKLYWLINGFMTNMGFVLWGGSPPPAAPTSTTVNQTNIPDYAQPYVMNMLNAAQAQIYNPSGTGFNPYIPYSNNPANYVAGPSPMQQQAYTNVANMQVPGQYGMATGQTLGASRQLGGLGQQMGMAGMNYANQATNPASVNAYMNPYIQASLAPQLQLANQQYGIAGQQEQSGATQAGAFGGSREALMNSLNQQNQMLAQNQLISQGYNNAFNQAQQAQQFGANLGLQGQQGQLAALQGQLGAANQLGSLGGAQLAAQQGISNQLNTLGQQQQQNQQQIINQAVQNYATAQQYPYMQLGTLNAMLRGLPMNQVSTATYMAPPSGISQLAGLGTAGLGLAKMAGAKKGGVIKAATGGIPLNMMSPSELKSPYLSPIDKIEAPFVQAQQQDLKSNPQAAKMIAQIGAQGLPPTPPQIQPPMIPNESQDRSGVASITTRPELTTMRAAGGGLLAFSGEDESLVPKVEEKETKKEEGLPIENTSVRRAPNIPNILASEKDLPPQVIEDIAPIESTPAVSAPVAKTSTDIPSVKDTGLVSQNILDKFKPGVKLSELDTIGTPLEEKPNLYPAPIEAEDPETEAMLRAVTDPKTGDLDLAKLALWDIKHPDKSSQKALTKSFEDYRKSMDERNKSAPGEALLRAGLGMMSGTSPYGLVNIGQGAAKGLDFMQEVQKENAAARKELATLTLDASKADREAQVQNLNRIIQGQYLTGIADKKTEMMSAGILRPEDLKRLSEQIRAGDKSPLQNMGYGPIAQMNKTNLQRQVTDDLIKSGATGRDIAAANLLFASSTSEARTVGTSLGNVEVASTEFGKMIPLARAASAEVPRNGFLPFGKLNVMFDENTNDPAIRKFAAANNSVVNTYARSINPKGVPTNADKDHARAVLSIAYDRTSYAAALDQLQAEVEAARSAPAEVRQHMASQVTGKNIPTSNNATNVNQHKATSGKTYTLNADDYKLFSKHYNPKD